MAAFLEIPREILHHILLEVESEDLATLTATCREFHSYIKHDVLLWKIHYLRHFDHPRRGKDAIDWSWPSELRRFINTKKILESSNAEAKLRGAEATSDCIIDLMNDAAGPSNVSRNLAFLSRHFKESPNAKTNVDTVLCGSSLFAKSPKPWQKTRRTEAQRQMSAKLHSLYGVPIGTQRRSAHCAFALTVENNSLIIGPSIRDRLINDSSRDENNDADELPTHQYARAKVYDLRLYTEKTLWGPFMDDGSRRVDWEKVEAVMVDLVYNMRKLHERSNGMIGPWWGTEAWAGATQNSYVARPKGPEDMPDEWEEDAVESIPRHVLDLCPRERDPYGITGTWMRVVCFLDYTDFHAYNFTSLHHEGQRPMDVQPLDVDEATRLISLELCATTIEPPGPDDGQELPVVHYVGTSRSMHAVWDANAHSKIRGTVRLTPEGEVHWTSFSIFSDNEERWRSEGIQVGGLRSARGILGHWFDKDFDPRGPAGPTAFWKISDEVAGLDVESAPPSPS